MPKAPYVDAEGRKSGEVELAAEIFDVQVNVPVMHEVVRAQLGAARAGTHSTKTRAEVRGGGRKPWRQKGTGRARHGSIREPQWVGGGVAHGPKPRDYSLRINRKVRALALASALTDRVRAGRLVVVDLPVFEDPDTKRAIELLKSWGAEGRTLIVIDPGEEEAQLNAWKSFRNLPEVTIASYPTAYSVLAADTVVFSRSALSALAASGTTSELAPPDSSVSGGEPAAASRGAAASSPANAPKTAAGPTEVAAEGPARPTLPLEAERAPETAPTEEEGEGE